MLVRYSLRLNLVDVKWASTFISVLGVSKHFLPNLVVSDGQDERFHFNIKLMKNIFRYVYV